METPALITNAQELANVLKSERKARGIRQSDIADLFRLNRSTVIDAESGKGDPKLSTAILLIEALGMRLVAVPANVATRLSFPPTPDEVEMVGVDDVDWDWDDDDGSNT